MDLVFFFEKSLTRRGLLSLPLLFAFFAGSCASPERPVPRGAGFGDVFQEIRWRGERLESSFLQVGKSRIPLAEPLFRLESPDFGKLGPSDFDGAGIEGLGTTRVTARFAGKRVPLEVAVTFRVRLEDPSFEKTLQVRWLGLPSRAPLLERVLVQALPLQGRVSPPEPPGRPLFLPGLCASLAVPWGRARAEGGRLFLEEFPRVSLQGGWWRSAPAVLCPSGSRPPQLAFLRWTAHERGGRERRLFFRGVQGGGRPPAKRPGFSWTLLEAREAERLAGPFRPEPPRKGRRFQAEAPDGGGTLLLLPPGTRAESPLFRKALGALCAGRKGLGALVVQGLDSRGDPRALRDGLALFRALSRGGEVFLAWDRKGPISPFWQALVDGQDGLDPRRDGPLLGQAAASLSPWRSRGEAWRREEADRLVFDLARGAGALDLGWIPAEGSRARTFLEGALAWAAAERELIRNAHTPFPGEAGAAWPGESWTAVKGGRLLWTAPRNGGGGGEALPLGKEWAWVVEIYPERRILRRGPEGEGRETVPEGRVVVLEAWLAGAERPQWLRAWFEEGGPPPGAPLPPLFGGPGRAGRGGGR